MIVACADPPTAHLYGDIDLDIYIEQTCDSTGKMKRAGHIRKLQKY